ncbi:ADP-ribosylation factor [Thraustotheca clavata]|uniref:ADP-ribosylation factor n=1 Tax=Thraustotheca clavata TaxID=74557 RepID=A0A1W0A3J6_9STRA|nr:ADP-ribosylation factor [Thraustotheca clavata]
MALLFIGLDGAGKTCLLRWLEKDKNDRIDPSVGVRRTTILIDKIQVNAWDMSGHGRDRSFPLGTVGLFNALSAIVYVVDANDMLRLGMSRDELWTILHGLGGNDLPLLVFLNKSEDASVAILPRQLEVCFNLKEYKGIWRIEACSALTGLGILAGINWVISKLQSNKL